MAETKDPLSIRDFSRVVLTLENVLLPDEKLSPTPSMIDGLDIDTETDLRIIGCELIQTSGILLKLPQIAMASGQIIFQRFYYSKSFVKHNMEVLAMACINLASKIEECPRRIRDVINVFHHVKQVRNSKTIHPLTLDQNYINLKNQVIKAERRVLKELGFCVHVKHPHKIIFMFLQVLECEQDQKLVQCAWNYMNDSFRTDVFMRYHPEVIACACIYLAARQLQISLPNNPPWFYVFNVDEPEIRDICLTILRLYARKKPNYEKLENKVNEVKKQQLELKKKQKGISSETGTPNSVSRYSPPNVSPNPALMSSIKRLKEENEKKSENGSVKGVSRRRRSHSHSDRSRSHSRSHGRSSDSRSSRSVSRSPSKRRKHRSPHKNKDKYYSPDRLPSKDHKHSRKRKKHSRSQSRSRSPVHRKSGHKKYYKEDRYHSPDRYHSKRHRNGHRSPSPRYDKYRR